MTDLRLISSTEPLDVELIEQTLTGDQSAFAILVNRYQKKMYRIALAIVRDQSEADSIAQDTFVTAYMKLEKFEGRSEFETWLTRIAINKGRDVLRRRKRAFVSISAAEEEYGRPIDIADSRPDAERKAISGQLANAIETAMESLSAQQKTIFRLRHLEELQLDEIADLMGLRPGTVRAHLFRAIHKVRNELETWTSPGRSLGDTP